jgi:hypothetical protein
MVLELLNIAFSYLFPELTGIQSCGPGKIECYDYFMSMFVRHELEDCNCLPGCNSIQFETEVSIYDLNMTNMAATHGDHLEE